MPSRRCFAALLAVCGLPIDSRLDSCTAAVCGRAGIVFASSGSRRREQESCKTGQPIVGTRRSSGGTQHQVSCSHAHTLPLPERLLPDAQAQFPSRTHATSTCAALLLTWLQHAPVIAPTAAWLLCTAVPRRVFMSMSMRMSGTHPRHARSAAACMETSVVCVGKGCCVMTRTRHGDHGDKGVWQFALQFAGHLSKRPSL